MFKHILIATDGSELARHAAVQALQLAKSLKAKITAVMVTEPWLTMLTGANEAAAAQDAAHALGAISELAKKAELTCATRQVKDHYLAEGMIAACKYLDCDLVVMGSHGRRGARLEHGASSDLPLKALKVTEFIV
jgi:nucleotide-binding universal stress UspA family protein